MQLSAAKESVHLIYQLFVVAESEMWLNLDLYASCVDTVMIQSLPVSFCRFSPWSVMLCFRLPAFVFLLPFILFFIVFQVDNCLLVRLPHTFSPLLIGSSSHPGHFLV